MIRYRLTIVQGERCVTMIFNSGDGRIPDALWNMCETALLHADDMEIRIERI